MIGRIFIAFTVFALIGKELLAQQNAASPKVGDEVVLRMTGELAKQYVQRIGSFRDNAPAGLEIETIATMTRKLDDGRIQIEHSSYIKRNEMQDRLITLTATVDSFEITTDLTPKGTLIYSSPASDKNRAKGAPTTEDIRTLRVQLSGLKGLKLRTWRLADEIGE